MAVYTIAFVICRKGDTEDTEVMPYMQVVSTNGPDSIDVAVDHVKNYFPNSRYGKRGWIIQGDPVLFEIHEGVYSALQECMSPAPVTRPVLTIVK